MSDYKAILRETLLAEDLVRANFSGRRRGQELRWERLVIRPVKLKGRRHLQFSFFDALKNVVENHTGRAAESRLDQVLSLPFRNFHVYRVNEDLQSNLTKKGKAQLRRTRNQPPREISWEHDRKKNTLLQEGQDVPFLRAIGIMRADGRVRANRRSKFQQINAFLKILAEVDEIKSLPEPVRMVDFGCGNAYLTFAAYHYLGNMLARKVKITGVDLQADLIERNNALVQQLGWSDLEFRQGAIAGYQAEGRPDIVVALHACDTASDDVIAQDILLKSKLIIVAPCCHHDLQVQLKQQDAPDVFAPLMRHGLLHERLGDVLIDSFRAMILKMMGYQDQVIQFVSPDHTPKNLLLRAVLNPDVDTGQYRQEYQALKSFWQVDPYLAKLLDAELGLD